MGVMVQRCTVRYSGKFGGRKLRSSSQLGPAVSLLYTQSHRWDMRGLVRTAVTFVRVVSAACFCNDTLTAGRSRTGN